MVDGFEKETKPLTEYELNTLVPIITRCMANKIGEERAIKNGYICAKMMAAGYQITPARLRKVINHIRTHSLLPGVIATSKGYYIATKKEEVEKYIGSLKSREDAIREVRDALLNQLQLYD